MNLRKRGTGGLIKPSPRWDKEGVASTVGTIMALMVFMALLSVFTNQYVPVWMEDNEAKHMNTVESQFGMLRWGIDNQILVGQLGGMTDVSVYNPISLGSEGVPMFASPTAGFLRIQPDKCRTNVSFYYNTGTGSLLRVNSTSSGSLEMYAPNRYYVQQWLGYENDAIILRQEDGMVMKSVPQFTVRQEGANYKLVLTQITLYGANKSYAGTGTTGVHTALRYTNTTTFLNTQGNSAIFFSLSKSDYANAWYVHLRAYLPRQGLTPNEYWFTAVPGVAGTPTTSMSLRLNTTAPGINGISSVTLNTAYFDILMGEVGE